jgi:hypothetical protein
MFWGIPCQICFLPWYLDPKFHFSNEEKQCRVGLDSIWAPVFSIEYEHSLAIVVKNMEGMTKAWHISICANSKMQTKIRAFLNS